MIKDYQVEAAAQAIAMTDGHQFHLPVKEAYELIARKALEAAYAAKAPEPVEEVVCTQKMKDAGGAVYLQYLMNTARGDMVADLDGLALAYTAMFKARPKEVGIGGACAPEVSDSAVDAILRLTADWDFSKHFGESCARQIVAVVTPHLSRHKAAPTPDIEVYKLNGEFYTCKNRRKGPANRRVLRKWCIDDPMRRQQDDICDRRQTQGTQTQNG